MKNMLSRIVLAPSVDRKNIDRLAWDDDWELYDLVDRSDESPRETIWLASNDEVAIHLINDHLIGVDYFILEGPNLESFVRRIRSKLDTYELDDLIEKAKDATNTDDFIMVLYQLAVAAGGKFNKVVFEIVQKAFASPEIRIRQAAIVAVGYLSWKEFHLVLEAVASKDTDQGVRKDAGLMLEGLQQASES